MPPNERRRSHHKSAPATTTTSALLTIPNPAEEAWVFAERECITQAREQKRDLMEALNLKGYRHDDHPAVWSRERVARLEQRRRRRGPAS